MMTVFIGGSRRITRLSKAIQSRLDNIIDKGFTVVTGDANGADKAVQKYFAGRHYKNVVVFCMGGTCRNNIGNWEMRNISPQTAKKDFNYYATKDLQMANEASCGFMIWDMKSKGTLNNIISACPKSPLFVISTKGRNLECQYYQENKISRYARNDSFA